MKVYLGDSVYAEADRGMIKLYLDNNDGIESGQIFLEPEVYAALKLFAKKIGWENE